MGPFFSSSFFCCIVRCCCALAFPTETGSKTGVHLFRCVCVCVCVCVCGCMIPASSNQTHELTKRVRPFPPKKKAPSPPSTAVCVNGVFLWPQVASLLVFFWLFIYYGILSLLRFCCFALFSFRRHDRRDVSASEPRCLAPTVLKACRTQSERQGRVRAHWCAGVCVCVLCVCVCACASGSISLRVRGLQNGRLLPCARARAKIFVLCRRRFTKPTMRVPLIFLPPPLHFPFPQLVPNAPLFPPPPS